MSIVELAKVAGVSKATVSRVLSGYPRVSSEAAEAVRRAVEQVGYERPKSGIGRPRRSPSGIQKGSIAFVFPDVSPGAIRTVLSGRLLLGVEQVLRPHRVGLQLSGLPGPDRLPAAVEDRMVDGVIFRGLSLNTVNNAALIQGAGRLPCVHVFEPKYLMKLPPTWDVVLEDNDAVARIAFDYLVARGRQRLAVVNPHPDHPSIRHRTRAFQELAEEQGVSVTVVTEAAPHEVLVSKLKAAGLVDGLFLPIGDDMCVGIYRALQNAGIRPLKDLDLISCNNDPARLATLDENLPNIDIQPEAIGRGAANMLLERLKTPGEPSRRMAIAPSLHDPLDASTPKPARAQ